MYSIYSKTGDKVVCLHDDRSTDKRVKVLNPKLKLGDSAAGSLEFKLPPTNIAYGKYTETKTTILGMENVGSSTTLDGSNFEQGGIDEHGEAEISNKYIRSNSFLNTGYQNGATSAQILTEDVIDATEIATTDVMDGAYIGKLLSKETITHATNRLGYGHYNPEVSGKAQIDDADSQNYVCTMFGWAEGFYTSSLINSNRRRMFEVRISANDTTPIKMQYVMYGMGYGVKYYSRWITMDHNTALIVNDPGNVEALGINFKYSDDSTMEIGTNITEVELFDATDTMPITCSTSEFNRETVEIEAKQRKTKASTKVLSTLFTWDYFEGCEETQKVQLYVNRDTVPDGKVLQYKILSNANLVGTTPSKDVSDPDWKNVDEANGNEFTRASQAMSFWVLIRYSDDSEILTSALESISYRMKTGVSEYWISSPYEDISGKGDEITVKTVFDILGIDLDVSNFEQGDITIPQGSPTPTKVESDYHIRMLCSWENFAGIGCKGTFTVSLTKTDSENQNGLKFKVINAANFDGTGAIGGDSDEMVYNDNKWFQHTEGAKSFWLVVSYNTEEPTAIVPSDISEAGYKFTDITKQTIIAGKTYYPLYVGMSYSLYDANYQTIVDCDERKVTNSMIHINLNRKVTISGREEIKVAKYIKFRYGYGMAENKINYGRPPINVDLFSYFSYGIESATQHYICQYDADNNFITRTGPYRMESSTTFASNCRSYKIVLHKANDDDIDTSSIVNVKVQPMKLITEDEVTETDLVERMRSNIIVKREISTPSITTYDNFDPVQTNDISDRFEQGCYYDGHSKVGSDYAVRTVSLIPSEVPAGGFVCVKCIGKLGSDEVDDTAANTYRFKLKYGVNCYNTLDIEDQSSLVYKSPVTESGEAVQIPSNAYGTKYIGIEIFRYDGSTPLYMHLSNLSNVEVSTSSGTVPTDISSGIENGGYDWYYFDERDLAANYTVASPFAVRTPYDKVFTGSYPVGTIIRVEATAWSIDGTQEEELDFGVARFEDTYEELMGYYRGIDPADSDGNVTLSDALTEKDYYNKLAIVLKRKDTNWDYAKAADDDHLHDSWKINQNQIISAKVYITIPGSVANLTNNDLDYSGNEMASLYTLCTGYLPLSNPAYTTSARIDLDTKQKYKMAWGIATYRLVDGQYEIIDMYRWLNTNDRFDKISGAPDAIRIFLKVATPDNGEEPVETELEPTDILNFKITVQRVEYNLVEKEIWEGRVLSEDVDWQNNRVIYCEGELAYLNDTRMAPRIFNNVAFRNYIQAIIDNHNSKVAVERRFVLGETWEPTKKKDSGDYDRGSESEEDDLTHHTTNFETSLELLNNLVNDYGGHLRIRKSSGVRYIDWLADWPRKSNQVVQFGKNLLDYTRKYDLSNLFTVLYPTGKVLVAAKSSAVGDHVSTDPSVWKRYENTLLYLDDSDKTNQRVLMNSGPKLYGYLTVVATVEPGATYYFSTRLHGGLVAYCLYDGTNGTGNLHSQGIERAGSDTTPGFVDYVDKEITIPPGFHSIAMCCFGGAIPLALKTQTKEVEGIDKVVTIEEVASDVDSNGKVWHTKGSPYIMNPDLVEKYGWIERRIALEALEKPQEVYTAAKKYLSEGQYEDITLEVSAIDLNSLGVDADAIDILDEVRCISEPHGLDRYFPVAEMEIPLNDPANQKFRMGSNPVQNLTTQHASSTNDLEQKASAIPTKNSVISTAKASAAAMLNDTTTGSFISYRYDEEGKMSEMIISDTKPDEDGSYPKGTQLWRWNSRGLAHSSDGYNFDELNLNCAITAAGEIIANSIYGNYLYGTMVGGAKVVVGSGLPQTAAEVNRMLPAEKQPDTASIISIRDAVESTPDVPFIDMYSGTLYFGGVNGQNERDYCGEIRGNFKVSQDNNDPNADVHTGLLIQTPENKSDGVIVINTPDLGVGTGGAIEHVQRTKTIELELSTGSGTKTLKFINGMLVDVQPS